jgi:hypothetical protein
MVRTSKYTLFLEVLRLKPTQCVRIAAGAKLSVLRTQYEVYVQHSPSTMQQIVPFFFHVHSRHNMFRP